MFGGYPGYFYLPAEMRYVADPLCGRTAPASESALLPSGPGMTKCRTGYRDAITPSSISLMSSSSQPNSSKSASMSASQRRTPSWP